MTSGERNHEGAGTLDGILVINPKNFIERRQSIERQLQLVGLPYEFIHSYDAGDWDETVTKRYFKNSLLSSGQRSCALKHLEALRLICERNWQQALVLEDDALLEPGFADGLRAALEEAAAFPQPYVLFVGSGGNQYTPRRLRHPGQCLYQAERGRLAEAYVVGSQAARLRRDWIDSHGIPAPIDNLFERIDREFKVAMYWLEPPIVEQGSKNGRFRSVLEPAPPNVIRRVMAMLQKLRRKYLY